MKGLCVIVCWLIIYPSYSQDFSFVFMTDIHIKHEKGAAIGFKKAIDTANKLPADFVITGGDLVFDVLRGNKPRADSLFRLYKSSIQHFRMPVYNCIGNHELFGIYTEESGLDSTDRDYKYGMYERYLGPTYYSFDHKGWHFIVLNSIEENNGRYIGLVGTRQLEWLKKDLSAVAVNTPIAVVTHIPLVSSFQQIFPSPGNATAAGGQWISNREEVLSLFNDKNLRLVLQGHLHWLEDINVRNKTRFITGGAIAGRPSWRGTEHNEEGFLHVKIKDGEISWDYIDYGWEPRE